MKYLFFLLGLLFILSVVSCHKNTPQVTPFMASDFPLKVGNKWTYQVNYYLYNNYYDTEVITIVDKQLLSKDSVLYTVHDSIYRVAGYNTQYLLTIGDTIVYNPLYADATPFSFMLLKLPFRPGDRWSNNDSHNDTTQVESLIASYHSSNDQVYKNGYFLKKLSPFSASYSDVESIVLSPGIGIIEYDVSLNDTLGILHNTNSTLISYQLQ
jgi:hypothetical protein